MPRKRNNEYEQNRKRRSYIKNLQISIDNLKSQIRNINSQDEKK